MRCTFEVHRILCTRRPCSKGALGHAVGRQCRALVNRTEHAVSDGHAIATDTPLALFAADAPFATDAPQDEGQDE